MLKVGDKVRVKDVLTEGAKIDGFTVTSVMAALSNKEAHIEKVRENGSYRLSIAWSGYEWSEGMLELIESAPEDNTYVPLNPERLVVMTPEEHEAAHHSDMVDHPAHYNKRGIETIELIKNGVEDFPSYCAGNIIKYVSRYPHKNGVEDLKKARWYLERLIKETEGEQCTKRKRKGRF